MRLAFVVVAALAAAAPRASAGALTLDPVVSADIPATTSASATIAVSLQGRVGLAIASERRVDFAEAVGASLLLRKTYATTSIAGRPQVVFDGTRPWLVLMASDLHSHVVSPERSANAPPAEVTPPGLDEEDWLVGSVVPPDIDWRFIAAAGQSGCVAYVGRRVWSPTSGRFERYEFELLFETPGGQPAWLPFGRRGDTPLGYGHCPECPGAIAAGPPGVFYAVHGSQHHSRGAGVSFIRVHLGGAEELVRSTVTRTASMDCPGASMAVTCLGATTPVVAYVLPPSTSDLRVARSLDGGASFEPAVIIGAGRNPCLAPLTESAVALAFDGADGVFLALSRDRGGTFATPVRVDEAKPGIAAGGVAIAAAPDGKALFVSWIERAGAKSRVALRRVGVP